MHADCKKGRRVRGVDFPIANGIGGKKGVIGCYEGFGNVMLYLLNQKHNSLLPTI